MLFSGADVKLAQLEPMATFADIGRTIADYMGIEATFTGLPAAYVDLELSEDK